MAFQRKTVILGDLVLALFDVGIREFLDLAAIRADEVIVMVAVIEFKHGLAAVELTAYQYSRLFKLGQDPIHRREANIDIFGNEGAIDIFSALMTFVGSAKNIKNLQAGKRRLKAHIFEFVLIVHS